MRVWGLGFVGVSVSFLGWMAHPECREARPPGVLLGFSLSVFLGWMAHPECREARPPGVLLGFSLSVFLGWMAHPECREAPPPRRTRWVFCWGFLGLS